MSCPTTFAWTLSSCLHVVMDLLHGTVVCPEWCLPEDVALATTERSKTPSGASAG